LVSDDDGKGNKEHLSSVRFISYQFPEGQNGLCLWHDLGEERHEPGDTVHFWGDSALIEFNAYLGSMVLQKKFE